MPPLVSILVPSYNHGRFVRECLGSAIAQTMTDWELVLVDDRSEDDSVKVAREVADSRIRLSENRANIGTYGTLQAALDQAAGEFVAVLNSDDRWLPTKLESQVALLRDHPDATFGYTLGEQIDEDGNRIEANQHADWPTAPIQELLPFLLRENRVLASSVLFRREGLNFHTECRYSGDWLALLERAVKGPAACVADPLTQWRMHDSNTHKRSPGQLEEEIWVREGIRSRRWERDGVDPKTIRSSLAQNEMHLAALYVLAGSIHRARLAAVRGLGIHPSTATARRVAATHLPSKLARKHLWPEEIQDTDRPDRPPLVWQS